MPRSIWTDTRRLQQVLKNLLSNAFKFTDRGEVVLAIGTAASGWTQGNPSLDNASPVIAFSVRDTGIGIPHDKQKLIFEAFQQLDGTPSRKYGGTGLGLAITREIARLLGGEVVVSSEPGEGSTFTFFVPHHHLHVHAPPRRGDRRAEAEAPGATPTAEVLAAVLSSTPPSIRNEALAATRPPPPTVLVIAADPGLARVAVDAARDQGFAAMHAPNTETALQALRERRPDAVAIHLDAGGDATALLARLEGEPSMKQVPLHVFTAARPDEDGIDSIAPDHLRDEMALFLHRVEAEIPERLRALQRNMTVDPPLAGRKILVVDDDVRNVFAVTALLERHGVEVLRAESAADGIGLLRTAAGVDLVIMDVMMPDMDGYDAMKAIRAAPEFQRLPIIALTAKAMKGDREKCLDAGASDYVTKPIENEQLLSLIRVWLYGAADKRSLPA
jgi:CheY-like chemotaxis protein